MVKGHRGVWKQGDATVVYVGSWLGQGLKHHSNRLAQPSSLLWGWWGWRSNQAAWSHKISRRGGTWSSRLWADLRGEQIGKQRCWFWKTMVEEHVLQIRPRNLSVTTIVHCRHLTTYGGLTENFDYIFLERWYISSYIVEHNNNKQVFVLIWVKRVGVYINGRWNTSGLLHHVVVCSYDALYSTIECPPMIDRSLASSSIYRRTRGGRHLVRGGPCMV